MTLLLSTATMLIKLGNKNHTTKPTAMLALRIIIHVLYAGVCRKGPVQGCSQGIRIQPSSMKCNHCTQALNSARFPMQRARLTAAASRTTRTSTLRWQSLCPTAASSPLCSRMLTRRCVTQISQLQPSRAGQTLIVCYLQLFCTQLEGVGSSTVRGRLGVEILEESGYIELSRHRFHVICRISTS